MKQDRNVLQEEWQGDSLYHWGAVDHMQHTVLKIGPHVTLWKLLFYTKEINVQLFCIFANCVKKNGMYGRPRKSIHTIQIKNC